MKLSFLVLALLATAVLPAGAMGLELGGFASLGGGQATYPRDSELYTSREDWPWFASFRLLAEVGDGPLHLTANFLESAAALPPLASYLTEQMGMEVERSSALTWEQHDSSASRAALGADVLALQYRASTFDVNLGRQPVSLATTFYFVPNDFFAPFAAHSFFRTYRPGVDGLRADLRLAPLSQLTVLAVLAYTPDPDSTNGWSRGPEWSRTTLLAAYNREWRGFGWSLLGGTFSDRTLVGCGLQGEFFDWLGVRAEGHYARAEQSGAGEGGRFALGFEHSYADNFDWRLEYYYNGYSNGAAIYQDRHYAALGFGYQFTPLLTGGLVGLADLSDGSQLLSSNLLYSLSDEAELALTVVLPQGRQPAGPAAGSEFRR
ncbi:MAG TPA: hypothetical protein VLA15_00560, partial [Desulfurivibrionaceae bacterium]|nr:hypothetical protein [Desulfurivibrionaceae bacterium]